MGIAESRLESFELFEGLDRQELSFIAANCEEMQIRSGETLIQEGQVGKDVYFLEKGTVCVFRGRDASSQNRVVLDGPAILGEMAMTDPSHIRTLNVVAESDLRLLSIPISAFLVFVRSCPRLKDRLRQLMADRKAQFEAKKSCPVAA